ncbi:hypothetical protein LWI29_022314 [Acer saccharum]|uniref:ATP binding protein n=1 Tax=Acer saccharum TaxID=4024 RepID=A0AA39SQ99_ACESA|nr:hypothetical protein LWI29_022314 [Acer saccharum]KAK1583374.1 hypothetical protein Q3G72_023163 [Acer saccharum]
METATETSPPPEIDGPQHSTVDAIATDGSDSPTAAARDHRIGVCDHDDLLSEMESLRRSNESFQSETAALEESLRLLQAKKDEVEKVNGDLKVMIGELSRERDSLHGEIGRLEEKLEEEFKEKEEIRSELEICRERIEVFESENKERDDFLLKILDSIKSVKENLVRIVEFLDDEKVIERETSEIWGEITSLKTLASEAESKVFEFKESKNKEKRELENSVVSLTEENRDINSILRIALVEKEAVEKSLNRLKGNNSEQQKRVALLQIVQRVGFGFMMGSGSNEHQSHESLGANAAVPASNKSDSSECEEEVVSLASTVERIMKNLRLEITQLRRSLDESRSDTERLQSLTAKQAKTIEENMLYIKELEDRERVLTQNVEELLLEIKATEEDVARWREACELEVEAGKNEIEERDKLLTQYLDSTQSIHKVDILKKELEKTKTALDISNGKLKLKEELAAAAMAAQAAAEKSLQLADSRAAGLREQIEQLTKQLEEAESKERSRLKVRHICWPWRVLRLNATANNNTNNRTQNVRRMLPEMQALLHSSV